MSSRDHSMRGESQDQGWNFIFLKPKLSMEAERSTLHKNKMILFCSYDPNNAIKDFY